MEIDLKPVDFIVVGTVVTNGKRVIHLQGGLSDRIVTLTLNAFQATALAQALSELIGKFDARYPMWKPRKFPVFHRMAPFSESLKSRFPVAQIGLGYHEEDNLLVIVSQELLSTARLAQNSAPDIVRFWCNRSQVVALSNQAMNTRRKLERCL